MQSEPRADFRCAAARLATLVLVTGLGLRLFQAITLDTPAAAAAPAASLPASLLPEAGASAVPPTVQVSTVSRIAWLTGCGGEAPGTLGLFQAGDPACRPARSVALGWLQSQLAAAGMLGPGEYLLPAEGPCLAQVLSSDPAAPRGWLCADTQGFYRADSNAQALPGHWQLWVSGK